VQTSYAARIMAISAIPYVIAQFPVMLRSHHGKRLDVLLALIVSFLLVLSYCLYQVNDNSNKIGKLYPGKSILTL
jgi:hypothetical protein